MEVADAILAELTIQTGIQFHDYSFMVPDAWLTDLIQLPRFPSLRPQIHIQFKGVDMEVMLMWSETSNSGSDLKWLQYNFNVADPSFKVSKVSDFIFSASPENGQLNHHNDW